MLLYTNEGIFFSSDENSGGTLNTDSTSVMPLRIQVLSNILLCLRCLQCVDFSLCLNAPGHKMVITQSDCFRQEIYVQGSKKMWVALAMCICLYEK